MHFLGLAVDFDGTIAQDGAVAPATLQALEALKASGRRLILVTGREQADLVAHFPQYALFDCLVLENGGLLLNPATGEKRLLAPPPDPALVEHLHRLGIARMSVGNAVIAAWEPDQDLILDAIRQSGLELQITFNKGAIMVLPTGVNKGTGLQAAAAELAIALPSLVGVGDAENDHSFLSICGCSVAVGNAIAALKSEVDIVLQKDHGDGVASLIADLLRLDAGLLPAGRRGLEIGTDAFGHSVVIPSHSGNVLVLGPSRSGKSTLATLLVEQIIASGRKLAIIDPEGDYTAMRGTTIVEADGTDAAPHYFELLLAARLNPVLFLRNMPRQGRAQVMRRALDLAVTMTSTTGTPGFVIIDEAHEAFAKPTRDFAFTRPTVVFLTLSPDLLAVDVLKSIGAVCAFGPDPSALLQQFCALVGVVFHAPPTLHPNEMIMWRATDNAAIVVHPHAPAQGHVRHAGKYATGDVGAERSFYFRGKDDALCRRARNLFEFLEIGQQVDEAVWNHHLYNGDIGRWFGSVIRDSTLADLAAHLQHAPKVPAEVTRAELSRRINARYCLPANVVG